MSRKLAAVLLSAAALTAHVTPVTPVAWAQKKEPAFGGKGVIAHGFVGEIYYLKPGTRRLPDFSKLTPVGKIYSRQLNIPTRSFTSGFPGVTKRFEWFAIRYRSRLTIRKAGLYRFRLHSDDGSKLLINGRLVINHDGVHPPGSKRGEIQLEAGEHTIEVQYFQGPRTQISLQFFWTPPDGKEVIFPGGAGVLSTPGVQQPPAPKPAPKPTYGYLSVTARDKRIAGAAQVILVLDSSGSMRAKLEGGVRRLTAAKRVMVRVIDQLPPFVRISLRAYGHRRRSKPKAASCRDTEVLVPFGRVDKAALRLAVARLKPRGQTPIGFSLSRLLQEFRGTPGPKLVLLVSDGIETCNRKPDDPLHPVNVIRRLRQAGIDVRVNVVGIDIGRESSRKFLKAIAKAGRGRYIDARDQSELDRAIREGLSSPYDVMDADGKVVARGVVGRGRVKLRTGTYRVVIRSSPAITIARVVIPAGRTRALFVRRADGQISVRRDTR